MKSNPWIGKPCGEPIIIDDFGPLLTDSDHWRLEENSFGAKRGQLLYADESRQASLTVELPIRPDQKHAIFIGSFSPGGRRYLLYVRLSDEKHFTNLQTERHEPAFEEMYFRTAELNGQHLELTNFDRDACIDYIKLVPVEQGNLPKPTGTTIGILDFADDAGISRPEMFEAGSAVTRHAEAGYDMIMWKAYAVRCEYHTKIGEIRGYSAKDEMEQANDGLASDNRGIASVLKKHDTMRQAVDVAHEVGLPIYGWARINNEFSRMDHQFSATTPFHKANPDKFQQHKDGRFTCKLSFAYPEVRQHKIGILCEIASYGMDGILIDVLRHPAMALYDGPIVEEFIKQGGEDPRHMDNDGSEDWLRFRCRAFTQFLKEASAALDEQRGSHVPLMVRTVDQPARNLVIGCDVDAWLAEGIVDGIIFGPHCATAENYPEDLHISSYLEKAKQTRIYGQVWRYGSGLHAEAMSRALYELGADGVALYESNATVALPSMRKRLWRFSRPESLPDRS
ncbi:MAG: hypothetical protein QF437_08170 [Planctomycetota bacterium]|jgi:hypothetical protein|nr:hypothetical protein [Planctomycetota bacterium]MDP7130450.1 hypothetical protein [Planctomycetota bacterium]MDP7254764.1 hypothetical protein [Planctomycetota bacterium]